MNHETDPLDPGFLLSSRDARRRRRHPAAHPRARHVRAGAPRRRRDRGGSPARRLRRRAALPRDPRRAARRRVEEGRRLRVLLLRILDVGRAAIVVKSTKRRGSSPRPTPRAYTRRLAPSPARAGGERPSEVRGRRSDRPALSNIEVRLERRPVRAEAASTGVEAQRNRRLVSGARRLAPRRIDAATSP